MARSYFKNADGVIIVYDVNSRNTFESIKFWLSEFESTSKNFDSSLAKRPVLLLGNKKDLDKKFKQIPTQELEQFAGEQGLICKEVSAKRNANKEIQNAVNKLIDLLVELSSA